MPEARRKQGPPEIVYVTRYTGVQRLNHWLTAAMFVLLALSGLAMFWPGFYWLSALFGGGSAMRMIHPWFGIVLFLSFLVLFVRFAGANIPNRDDVTWVKRFRDVVTNRDEKLPELYKYNAGQKFVFWSQSILIAVMLVTGIIIWAQYFSGYTSIDAQRIAILIHAASAVLAITVIIIHVYAALWVSGTMRAMTRGTVTGGWAYRHHRKWLRQQLGLKSRQPTEG